MKFRAVLLSSGKTATGVEVPAEIVARLGAGKRPKVKVKIGDYSYRSSVAPMGGIFMLGVSAEVRAETGVAPGEHLEVELELDTEPREVAVPTDFETALDLDDSAKQFFEGLSYSNKRRLVLAIDAAKTAETRQRRIEKTIMGLREGHA